jgi:hypothetical protein
MRSCEEKEETVMKLTSNEWLCDAGRWATRKLVVLIVMTGVLGFAPVERAGAEVSTTTVQGTVYLANGQPGSGMLHVSWPAFMSANGQAIVADSLDVTIGQDGFLSVQLAPNQGAMPAGLFYTAVFYMSDESVSTQYWVIPAAAQATVAQVQAQVMPAAQAVQVVDKLYVDGAIAQLSQSALTGSGGTLTGPLYLSGDPTQPLQAASKHYVDQGLSQLGNNGVNPAIAGQLAVYSAGGTSLNGVSTVPVSAGGTGSATAADALQSLGGISLNKTSEQTLSGPLNLSGSYDLNTTNLNQAATAQNVQNVAPRSVKEFGARGDGNISDFKMSAGSHTVQLVDNSAGYYFTPGVVGDLISLPQVDSDHGNLYTTITGYTDSTHVTVAAAAAYSFDGTGTWTNQAMWGHDDLAGINAAITAATTGRAAGAGATREGAGYVYLPCGYYTVSGQVSIPTGVRLEGASVGCAEIVYMGTTAIDATVEVSYGAGANWMRQGFFLTTTNHPELGAACTGTNCSPAVPNYITGSARNLVIYGNKFSNWAFSVLSPYSYIGENISLMGGNKGCFYHLNDVQTTWTHLGCQRDLYYGNGAPVNGIYSDGSNVGSGAIPMKLQSPVVSWATGTALVFNLVASATVSDGQLSANHQTLSTSSTTEGITFEGGLFEGGAVNSVVGGQGHIFTNSNFSDYGLVLFGNNITFNGGTIAPNTGSGGALTVSGENAVFNGTVFPNDLVVVDTAKTTTYGALWDWSTTSPKYNFPYRQQAVKPIGYDNSPVHVSGSWNLVRGTTPVTIATTPFTVGKAWKALFLGSWYYYGLQTSIPPVLELTDTANTVTLGTLTATFTVTSGGRFSIQANAADTWTGFSGEIYIFPRDAAAGSGGTNSMKLAGNVQAPGVQVAAGTVMTGNHGTGTYVQHSDGTGASGGLAVYAADGSVTAGPTPPTGAVVGTTDTQTLTNKSIAGSEINSGTVGVANGGTGQNESAATGVGQFSSGAYSVSTALANGTTATTQSAGDNSTKVATTSYVASPGAIAPTTVTASGIVTGGNDTTRTTPTTIATTGFTTTGLVLPTVPVNTTKNGRCVVLWQMSSTSYTATFGVGMSNAPTGLWGGTSVTYAASGTSNWLAFSQTATTATAVSTPATAGATGTTYRAEVDFSVQTGATNSVAITLYGSVSNASGTLTIQPGSSCHWMP